jgi:hypothetical protein
VAVGDGAMDNKPFTSKYLPEKEKAVVNSAQIMIIRFRSRDKVLLE